MACCTTGRASGELGEDGAIRFWNQQGESISGVIPPHISAVLACSLLPDGRLVSCDHSVIRFWDPKGVPKGDPWFAPVALDFVTVVGSNVWLFLQGRPYKLIINERDK